MSSLENHPIATGLTGGALSALGWLTSHLPQLTDLAQFIAAFFGAASAILTFAFLLRKAVRGEWRKL